MKTTIVKSVWSHGFVPLTFLTLYFLAFYFFLSWLLPGYDRTVNVVFVGRAWKISLFLAGVSLLIFLALWKAVKGNKLALTDSKEKLSAGDFLLILLPLAPVVQYIFNNQDILSPLGSLYVLAVFVAFSLLFIIVMPILLGIVGSTKTLMILGMTFTFMITAMASLSAKYRWFQTGNLKIQLIIFGGIFIIGWILYRHLIGRKFMYLFIAVFFLINSVMQLTPEDWAKTTPSGIDTENKLVKLVGSKFPLTTPNIYLLIYDAYVINETMLGYGIDNSAQEEYLEGLGFKIYPHNYSVGEYSIASMSRTLEISTDYYSGSRRGVSGDGVVHNLLKGFGYETHGIFPSSEFFLGIGSSYDFSFPEAKSKATPLLLTKAIFMGEFRFDVDFDRPSDEQFLKYRLNIFENPSPKPRFVYMHAPFPNHSQNSGACRPNETELFKERLIKANWQMKQDLETITQNDPNTIVLVAGDHGPYLTKNCIGTGSHYDVSEISRLDIQDRFGSFLAIKWPPGDFSEYDDITVLQDIFPAILAYLFQDKQLLEAKIEARALGGSTVSGASVENGIIRGGINDGEPLYVNPE